jgi:hypothetical protein
MENSDQREHYSYPATKVSSSFPLGKGGVSLNLDMPRANSFSKNSDGTANVISKYEIINILKDWYRYLLSKGPVVLLAILFGGTVGLAYALLKRPVYTAATTFVLESTEGAGGGLAKYASIANMVGLDIPDGASGIFQGDNIIDLYKSRTMIKKTLLSEMQSNGQKELLIDRYVNFNHRREKWQAETGMAELYFNAQKGSFNRARDSIINEIIRDINKNYLTVEKPDKKLSLIKVEVKAKDEAFAKAFNEQIVRNVNDFYVRTKTKKLLGNIGILQKKTDSVRTVMNRAIYTAASVTDATPNLNQTREAQRAAPVQRSQFSAETNKAILGELVKNLEMSKITLLKETPLIQVVDQPELPLEVKKIGAFSGIIIGGLLGGFLIIVLLTFRRILIQ